MGILLILVAPVQEVMNPAVLDDDVFAEDPDPVSCGIADFTVSYGYIVGGNLNPVATLPFAVDEVVLVDARLADDQPVHAFRVRIGPDMSLGPDRPCLQEDCANTKAGEEDEFTGFQNLRIGCSSRMSRSPESASFFASSVFRYMELGIMPTRGRSSRSASQQA